MRMFRSFHTVTQSNGSNVWDLDKIERKAHAMECHCAHIGRMCVCVCRLLLAPHLWSLILATHSKIFLHCNSLCTTVPQPWRGERIHISHKHFCALLWNDMRNWCCVVDSLIWKMKRTTEYHALHSKQQCSSPLDLILPVQIITWLCTWQVDVPSISNITFSVQWKSMNRNVLMTSPKKHS